MAAERTTDTPEPMAVGPQPSPGTIDYVQLYLHQYAEPVQRYNDLVAEAEEPAVLLASANLLSTAR